MEKQKLYFVSSYRDGGSEHWISEDRKTHIYLCYSFSAEHTDKYGKFYSDIHFANETSVNEYEFMPHPYSRFKRCGRS